MNRIAILIAALLLVLSGCDKNDRSRSGFQYPPPTEIRCLHAFATINTMAPKIQVHPETVVVQMGCKLILQIVPPRKIMGDVTIKHEDSPNAAPSNWLDKTNAGSTDLILIDVPKDAAEGEYKYSVSIPGFDKLDPHAEVIP